MNLYNVKSVFSLELLSLKNWFKTFGDNCSKSTIIGMINYKVLPYLGYQKALEFCKNTPITIDNVKKSNMLDEFAVALMMSQNYNAYPINYTSWPYILYYEECLDLDKTLDYIFNMSVVDLGNIRRIYGVLKEEDLTRLYRKITNFIFDTNANIVNVFIPYLIKYGTYEEKEKLIKVYFNELIFGEPNDGGPIINKMENMSMFYEHIISTYNKSLAFETLINGMKYLDLDTFRKLVRLLFSVEENFIGAEENNLYNNRIEEFILRFYETDMNKKEDKAIIINEELTLINEPNINYELIKSNKHSRGDNNV